MNTTLDIILIGKETGVQNDNAYVLEMNEGHWTFLFVLQSPIRMPSSDLSHNQSTAWPSMC